MEFERTSPIITCKLSNDDKLTEILIHIYLYINVGARNVNK